MSLKEHIKKHQAEFDNEKMSSASDAIFEQKLQKSLHSKRIVIPQRWRYLAAASILVISALILWNQYKNLEDQTFKQEFLSNLQEESTGKRLEAVYSFNDSFQIEDNDMIKVLVKTLLNDKNSNVKIATIDALLQFPKNEYIRKNLIKAIEKEKEPLVQIKLIKSLKTLRESRAQKPLENIINNDETYPIVKNNATLAIAELKK